MHLFYSKRTRKMAVYLILLPSILEIIQFLIQPNPLLPECIWTGIGSLLPSPNFPSPLPSSKPMAFSIVKPLLVGPSFPPSPRPSAFSLGYFYQLASSVGFSVEVEALLEVSFSFALVSISSYSEVRVILYLYSLKHSIPPMQVSSSVFPVQALCHLPQF